jgi:alpha-glucosidase
VPGFGGNASTALFVDWYKAGFLFPFLRNHSMRGFKHQEPWIFPKEALAIVRRYVRLRYKLLPYLYNLFVRHEDEGEAILRPLFYDFEDTKRLPLAHVNEQFLIGPSLMQAPFTVENLAEREIAVPAARWWRADRPGWVAGPMRLKARRVEASTPLFLREGSLIPMQAGIPKDNAKNLKEIELLLVLPPDFKGKAEGVYACDDGETFAYREGARTVYRLAAEVRHGTLHLEAHAEKLGFGPIRITPVTLERFAALEYRDPDGKTARLRPEPWQSDIWGAPAVFTLWR